MTAKVKSCFVLGLCLCLLAGALILAFTLVKMENNATPNPSPQQTTLPSSVTDDGFAEVDWDYWQSINPAIRGWVSVPGTSIDVPIVQASSSDPTFYLTHDIYGAFNFYGCPYLDAGCASLGFGSPHSVVFGHNVNDGSMFAPFTRYTDAGFAQENAEILLQTPSEKIKLSVLAVDIIDGSDPAKRTDFSNTADFRQWYAAALANADVVVNSTLPDAVISFVTCSYNYSSDERTIVYASA